MNTTGRQPDIFGTRNLDGWLDRINQVCGRFRARTLGDDFRGDIETFTRNALNLSCVDARSAQLYRTARDVSRDDCEHYYVVFQLSGHACMAQDDQRARLSPHDITLIDSSQPCNFQFSDTSRQLSLVVPRPLMHTTLGHQPVRCTQRIDGQSHLGGLANQLIASTVGQDTTADAQESEAIITALLTLLHPLLTDGNQASPHARCFNKAVDVIQTNLCDPDLTPAGIAREVGVSVRSLYRTFAARELTVAQYIRTHRLELSARRLRHSQPDQQLSALCFACGFSDTSYFSTTFKRHFGMSPTQYRAMGRH